MKNEKLVFAISDIDDALIEEAHETSLCRRRIRRAVFAAAACFVMLFAFAVVWHGHSSIKVFVSGDDIATGNAVTLYEDELATFARAYSAKTLEAEIPLTIKTRGECVITVSNGCVAATDSKSGETLSGDALTVFGNTEIVWGVGIGDPSSVYEMTIKKSGGELIITLTYDSASRCWTIAANDK